MNLQIDFWQLVGLLLTGLGTLIGVMKFGVAQAQKHQDATHAQLLARLDAMEQADTDSATQWGRIEREMLQLKADLVLDNDKGTVQLQLQGFSNPPQLVLNLISPTQPERDRRVVMQAQADGSYTGNLLDAVEGRRFVELIGQEGGKDWRLFEEEQLASGQRIHLGE